MATPDLGRAKLAAAAERLRGLNPNVTVEPFRRAPDGVRTRSRSSRDFDVVADGTDNFPTRYLVNDACVLLGKPNVYASVFRFEGQASVFWAEKGPATAACTRSRRRRGSCRPARRPGCSASCPGFSA